MGWAIAEAARRRGAEVTVLASNVNLPRHPDVRLRRRADGGRPAARRARRLRLVRPARDGRRRRRLRPGGRARGQDRQGRRGAPGPGARADGGHPRRARRAPQRPGRRRLRGRARARRPRPRPRQARAQAPRPDRPQRRLGRGRGLRAAATTRSRSSGPGGEETAAPHDQGRVRRADPRRDRPCSCRPEVEAPAPPAAPDRGRGGRGGWRSSRAGCARAPPVGAATIRSTRASAAHSRHRRRGHAEVDEVHRVAAGLRRRRGQPRRRGRRRVVRRPGGDVDHAEAAPAARAVGRLRAGRPRGLRVVDRAGDVGPEGGARRRRASVRGLAGPVGAAGTGGAAATARRCITLGRSPPRPSPSRRSGPTSWPGPPPWPVRSWTPARARCARPAIEPAGVRDRAALGRPRDDRGRAGGGEDRARQEPGARRRLRLLARAVHGRPAAGGRHRRHRLGSERGRLPLPPRAGVRQPRPGRRDQPRLAEDPVGAARVHGGGPGDGGRRDPRAAAPLHDHRHPEPGRVRGHLPAARGPARPLRRAGADRLPVARARRPR